MGKVIDDIVEEIQEKTTTNERGYNPWWDILYTLATSCGKEKVKNFSEYSKIKDYDELMKQRKEYKQKKLRSDLYK